MFAKVSNHTVSPLLGTILHYRMNVLVIPEGHGELLRKRKKVHRVPTRLATVNRKMLKQRNEYLQ